MLDTWLATHECHGTEPQFSLLVLVLVLTRNSYSITISIRAPLHTPLSLPPCPLSTKTPKKNFGPGSAPSAPPPHRYE